jgi:probable rRNA maturation factor
MDNPLSDDGAPADEAQGPIIVQVDDAFEAEVDAADIVAAVVAALDAEAESGEVTVVITSDEAVAELNEQYRATEGPTDVLSFPAQDDTPGFVIAPEMATYLGDIIIALPYTRRQAAALERSLRDELRLLAIHGTLHLLGYDHAEPEEEAEMWAKQDAILARLS